MSDTKDILSLKGILDAAEKIVSFTSSEFKQKNVDVDWKSIKGLRNIIAHEYFGVDAEEIWGIIQLHIPTLISSIRINFP